MKRWLSIVLLISMLASYGCAPRQPNDPALTNQLVQSTPLASSQPSPSPPSSPSPTEQWDANSELITDGSLETILPTDVYDEIFLSDMQNIDNGQVTRFLDEIYASFRDMLINDDTRMDMDISFVGPTKIRAGKDNSYYALYDFFCFNRTDWDRHSTKGTVTVMLVNSKWELDSWDITGSDYTSPYIHIDFGEFVLQPGQFIETEDVLNAIPSDSEYWLQFTRDYYRENRPVVYEKDDVTLVKIGDIEYSILESDLSGYKWVVQDMLLSGSAIEKWFYYHLKRDYKLKSAMGKDDVIDALGQPLIEGKDYLLYQVCYPATSLMLNKKVGIHTANGSGYIQGLLQENYLYCYFDENGLSAVKFTISRDHRIAKGLFPDLDVYVYVLSKDPFYIMQWKKPNYYNKDRNAESVISPVGRMLVGYRSNDQYRLLWDSDRADGSLAQDYAYNGLKCGDYSEDGNTDMLIKTNDNTCATFFMYFDGIYNVKANESFMPILYDLTKPVSPKTLNEALRHWDVP